MAFRSMTRGTWGPAASVLRRSSGGAGTPAAAGSRFLGTIGNQHSNGTQKEIAVEKAFLLKELDKVEEALRQRGEEVDKLRSELYRVAKIYAVSLVGIYALGSFSE